MGIKNGFVWRSGADEYFVGYLIDSTKLQIGKELR